MRLFGLHAPLTERWRGMRRVLRRRILDQRQRLVVGGLPVTGLRVAVGVGVAGVLAYLLGDRVLTPGRFVALFQGVDDMLGAGSSLGFSSWDLQVQSGEVGYVREFLGLGPAVRPDPGVEGGPAGRERHPRRAGRQGRGIRPTVGASGGVV